MKLQFGKGLIRCNNRIPLDGHKNIDKAYGYCRKWLDKRDENGIPFHQGPCSPNEGIYIVNSLGDK